MVDSVDKSRDEQRRVAERQQDRRPNRSSHERAGQKFLSTYQTRLKTREPSAKDENQKSNLEKGNQKENAGLLERIIQVSQKKDQGGQAGQEESREFNKKKEEDKKDDRFFSDSQSTTKPSDEGHQRIEGTLSSHHQGEGSGQNPSDGGSFGSRSGKGFLGGGFGGGSSGFSDSKHGQSDSRTSWISHPRAVQGVSSVGSQGDFSKKRDHFSKEILNEIVTSVVLKVHKTGDYELDIQLSDDFFHGLRLKVIQSSSGVILVFICPHREVKTAFLANRLKIYERLQEKNISILRIDIV